MNLKRWLMLLPVALLCPTWALADPASADFEIIFAGFDPNKTLTATTNLDEIPPDLPQCIGSDCDEFVFDPLIRLNAGGGSPGVGTTFSFNTGTGAGFFDFKNESGVTFTSLEITYNLPKAEYDSLIAAGVVFACDPGTVFATCGVQVVDPPPDTDDVNFIFSGGSGIPSTAAPEPAQWIVISLGFAGIVIARRKFRASSAYSQN
jgi:hypothetical protein